MIISASVSGQVRAVNQLDIHQSFLQQKAKSLNLIKSLYFISNLPCLLITVESTFEAAVKINWK